MLTLMYVLALFCVKKLTCDVWGRNVTIDLMQPVSRAIDRLHSI